MRLSLLPALLAVVLAAGASAQVCPGDVVLSSQDAVNSFNCSEVEGDLTIQGTGISDLTPMTVLRAVGGRLTVTGTRQLISLDGLDSHRSVTRGILVSENESLVTLRGLSGLSTLDRRAGYFVYDNSALESLGRLGVPGAAFELRDVHVERNPRLRSLQGMNAITLAREMAVWGNVRLESLRGLDGLASAAKFLIYDNPVLESLEGAGSLAQTGNIEIVNNDALRTLDGLTAIAEAIGYIYIGGNASLTQCSCGLDLMIEAGEFAHAWAVDIENNAPGGTCTSPAAVLATPCAATPTEPGPSASVALSVAPNPSARGAQVAYEVPEVGPVTVSVFDALGRRVAVLADGAHAAGEHDARLPQLAPGAYVVRIVTGEGVRALPVTVAR